MTDEQLKTLTKYALIVSLTALLAGGYELNTQLQADALNLNAVARAMLAPLLTGIATSLLPSLKGDKPPKASDVDVSAMTPAQRKRLAMKLKQEMLEQP